MAKFIDKINRKIIYMCIYVQVCKYVYKCAYSHNKLPT